jgi:hypothetical protein
MSNAKQVSKRKSRACAVPLLTAGLSLSLASGASAATEVPVADVPTQNTEVGHEITLGEEEIADVSLATFYVFDKENVGTSRPGVQLAMRGCGGGCRGCGGGCRGCGGCHRGCGGCHRGCGGGCVFFGIGGGCGGCGGGNCWAWTRFGWVWAC